ncbi:phosphotransferase family protein [Terrisporobacter petrolearius]|uniref:phosphotransferase family protein n=1 Tax=Terrisporobacter petrolearius TaxID=1460447 RepID=UPI003B00EBCE
MFTINGLEEYVKRQEFLEALNIPKDSKIDFQLLAQGEYNINYLFTHPVTKDSLILRVNTASQMNLSNQIEYEYKSLLQLKESNRTPIPIYVDGSKKHLDYGVLVMNFLQGVPLDYRKDLYIAANCLGDIHSVELEENSHLLCPKNPLQAIIDECEIMIQTYYNSDLGDEEKKKQIKRMLSLGQRMIKGTEEYNGRRCIINTELNSSNFLINGENSNNYIIDWEKPILGEPAQDLGHFLAPTTTFWKTDVILSQEEIGKFTEEYIKVVGNNFNTNNIANRLNLYIPITCLRGITWCAMAWVQYKDPDKLIRNEFTAKKLDDYLSKDFLDMIENRYFKSL